MKALASEGIGAALRVIVPESGALHSVVLQQVMGPAENEVSALPYSFYKRGKQINTRLIGFALAGKMQEEGYSIPILKQERKETGKT